MDVSLIGLLVVAILVTASAFLGPPLVVATIAAFAFGATAIGSLPALGGSSPLIYVVPGSILIATLAIQRNTFHKVAIVLMRDKVSWAVLLVTVYSVASAVIMPRLFEGETTAFISAGSLGIMEIPLAPTSGNVSQTAYFVFGAIAFLAFSVLLLRDAAIGPVARGFFLWAALIAAFGAIDRIGKLVGAGDVLEPIRTASYSMLTSADLAVGNVTRISGAFSEASAFGSAALASFAFSFAYWRRTGSSGAMVLAVTLLVLLLLSTSTTAYAGFAVLILVQLAALVRIAVTNRFARSDLLIVMAIAVGAILVLIIFIANQSILDPVSELFRVTILEKDQSQSGNERNYWNARSLDNFFDTAGLGIGMGSSRASSWAIATLSQLGGIGALLMATIVVGLFGRCPAVPCDPAAQRIAGLHDGARLSALTMLLAATISGGQADPGSLFFIALATALGCRAHLRAALGGRAEPVARCTTMTSGYAHAVSSARRARC